MLAVSTDGKTKPAPTVNCMSDNRYNMPKTDKRKRVRTSAPESQIGTWEAEAEAMNVTRAEYIRLMIQAGRRQFPACETDNDESEGIQVEMRVLDALEENGELTWGELVEEAVGDVEDKVEDAIEELEEQGRVSVSLRENTVSLR